MPKEPGRWPNWAAQDRDEAYQISEQTKRTLEEARKREGVPTDVKLTLADAIANQERIARLLERNGAKEK